MRLWRHLKALFKAWRFRRFQVRQLCFSCGFFKKRSVMSRRKQRSAFDQVSVFDRGRIMAYRDCGSSFREIGSRVGRNQTPVMRICDHWMQEGTMDQRGPSHSTLSLLRIIQCLRVPFDAVYSRVVCPQDVHYLVYL
ncbi:uncharacterized protein TNCV_1030531 [Trichonephila clavipes]|nr:uncharacterized protein TNCV_1030531 [Trichonephila clavipes]